MAAALNFHFPSSARLLSSPFRRTCRSLHHSIPSASSFPSSTLHLNSVVATPSRRSGGGSIFPLACLPPPSPTPLSSAPKQDTPPSTRLYVSGLSFRTTEESLRNAFQGFGQLLEVNLVMDRVANRPRGFAFLRYSTEEGSKKAIEGMHGKFLDGRVIFVEVAKPRSELRQGSRQSPKRY